MGLMKMAFRRFRKLVAWFIAIAIVIGGLALAVYVAMQLGWLP